MVVFIQVCVEIVVFIPACVELVVFIPVYVVMVIFIPVCVEMVIFIPVCEEIVIFIPVCVQMVVFISVCVEIIVFIPVCVKMDQLPVGSCRKLNPVKPFFVPCVLVHRHVILILLMCEVCDCVSNVGYNMCMVLSLLAVSGQCTINLAMCVVCLLCFDT